MARQAKTSDGRVKLFRKICKIADAAPNYMSYAKSGDNLAYGTGHMILSQIENMADPHEVIRLNDLEPCEDGLPPYGKFFNKEHKYAEVRIPKELNKCLKAFRRPTMPKRGEVYVWFHDTEAYVRDNRDDTTLRYTGLEVSAVTDGVCIDFLFMDAIEPKVLIFEDRKTVPVTVEGSYNKVVDQFKHVVMSPRMLPSAIEQ